MTLAANIRGLPEDFRRYFYESEMMTQVYLNDSPLFEATLSMTENGGVRLLRTLEEPPNIDQDVVRHWSGVLAKGVSIGHCTRQCPGGLIAVEYRLDNAELRLYTAQYETARVQESFISLPQTMPGGMIMFNDISLTHSGNTRSWGVNTSVTTALANWTQKASFQSSGTDGRYHYSTSSLYELYAQKELPGQFVRVGFFTPGSDTGNVEMTGSGYETVVGAMWGTSDSLLIRGDSVSAWPVYVTGQNQSVAEVWRDGRLIHTQQLQAGVQALDTRRLPGGIYDITINIIESGHIVETQQAQIYKPQGWNNPEQRWRVNLWSGQYKTIGTDATYRDASAPNPLAAGGGIDFLVHPRAVLGLSGVASEAGQQLRARGNVTLTPEDSLFAQYTQTDAIREGDVRYYRTITGGGSASLYWRATSRERARSRQREDSWGTSVALRLPWSTSLTLNGQYTDSAWRQGFGGDVSATTLGNMSGRNINFRISGWERPGGTHARRDRGLSLAVSLSLEPAARHLVSAQTGMTQRLGFSSLNYQWQPGDDSALRTLGAGVSYSPQNTVISANTSLETPFVSANGWVQHNTRDSSQTAGGNLSQILVAGGGEIAAVSGSGSRSMASALIVDVESDNDVDILAAGSMAETRLLPGKNVIAAEQWKKNNIQFTARGGDSVRVFPAQQSVQLNRGSVQYVKVQAVKTYTLIATLLDENGEMMTNRQVSSDVAGSVINAEGVLTLEVGVKNRRLSVRKEYEKPALVCLLPPVDAATAKDISFISAISCNTLPSGAKAQ